MDKKEIISTLNDLIETSKDGEAGFRTCAEDMKDPQIKTLFENRSQGCAAAAAELQHVVESYGGKPETGSSISGTLHRRWVDLKSAITGKDEYNVLQECERGEDVAIASYRKALQRDLPAEVRAIIERQYHGVLKNHDEVRALRDQYRPAQH